MPVGSVSSRPMRSVALGAFFVAASVLVAGCGRGGSNGEASAEGARAREAVLTVTAAEMQPVELARTVTMNGSIYAWQDVIIASEVGGYRVAEVNVDVGDHVKRGQVLVELSTALLAADVATKQAMVKQREAEAVNA